AQAAPERAQETEPPRPRRGWHAVATPDAAKTVDQSQQQEPDVLRFPREQFSTIDSSAGGAEIEPELLLEPLAEEPQPASEKSAAHEPQELDLQHLEQPQEAVPPPLPAAPLEIDLSKVSFNEPASSTEVPANQAPEPPPLPEPTPLLKF